MVSTSINHCFDLQYSSEMFAITVTQIIHYQALPPHIRQWIHRYLPDRFQVVDIGGEQSVARKVYLVYSVKGPLLFAYIVNLY